MCNSVKPHTCLDYYIYCCAPDDDALLDSGVNEDLGTIQIEMKLVEYFSEAKKFSAIHVPEIGSVHERSKKAGVHAVA